MKKHKFIQLTTVILITILSYGFVTNSLSEKTISTSSYNITTSGTYEIRVIHYPNTSVAQRTTSRNCVASTIGTYIIKTETCSSNPDVEILTFAHRILLQPTNGSNVLPDEDQDEKPGDTITITGPQVMEITNNCGIITLTDNYNCNDLSNFKYAF